MWILTRDNKAINVSDLRMAHNNKLNNLIITSVANKDYHIACKSEELGKLFIHNALIEQSDGWLNLSHFDFDKYFI